ncbi:SGNH/GDSL hydrolase family protein [Termitidicoccus mucosus]|uniref:SGNH hydrolase-type esterase domain-containing protein n=1 Tax=Termitidicoccus mucosus TaxID=1184151 RepID=A0A178IN31_9BACT|nr:hypothetical protein AW736_07350 [Opitutaceae bacterium TSB47]
MRPRPTPSLVLPLLAAILALAPCVARAGAGSAVLRDGDLVAPCGDSLTEQKHYTVFMETYLLACQPAANLRTMQFGMNGDTTWGFLSRLRKNTAPFAPDVATVLFGMNDGGYLPPGRLGDRAERYRESLRGIVGEFRAAGAREIIIASPTLVDPATFKRGDPVEYNQTLDLLAAIAREVAEREGARFADVHGAMKRVMEKAKAAKGAAYEVGGDDGVHPGANGHLVITHTLLKALGCDGRIGTLTWDCAARRAEATPGHRVLSVTDGTLEIESTRHPFCFIAAPPNKPPASRTILDVLPFNEELNSLILVVKNAPAPRMRVSWGEWSRVYTAGELARGVNLAADFLDNPFCESFARLTAAVREKQDYETDAVKIILSSLGTWEKYFPEEQASSALRREKVVKKSVEQQAAVRAALQPVRHTLQLESVRENGVMSRQN